MFGCPCRQRSQIPHARIERRTTRSPPSNRRVSGPTSTTSPVASWPMTTPTRRRPVAPTNPWTSEPQIPDARTATTTSPGPATGSGRSSSGIDWGPRDTSAFTPSVRRALRAGRPQLIGRLLRGEIALGLREELVAHHELSLLRVEQGREEVGVEL